MTCGRIFKIESMGLVDGPGIRVVVFFQGCPLRCKFCHNPESHDLSGGETVTVDALIKKILRFRPYFDRSGGGVTLSGGEPLMQPEFLLKILKALKKENIHTCLDTSGGCGKNFDEILSFVDTVLYDVKAKDSESYKSLCGGDIFFTEKFLSSLNRSNAEVIVRQVVIPGINDNDDYMTGLKNYISEKIPRAKKVELLPFHKMGEHKYKELGIDCPFENIPAMNKDLCKSLWERHFKDMEDR